MFNIIQSPLAFTPKYYRYSRKAREKCDVDDSLRDKLLLRFVCTDRNHATCLYPGGCVPGSHVNAANGSELYHALIGCTAGLIE